MILLKVILNHVKLVLYMRKKAYDLCSCSIMSMDSNLPPTCDPNLSSPAHLSIHLALQQHQVWHCRASITAAARLEGTGHEQRHQKEQPGPSGALEAKNGGCLVPFSTKPQFVVSLGGDDCDPEPCVEMSSIVIIMLIINHFQTRSKRWSV